MLSKASKRIQEPLVPMFFPVLGAHISGAEFQYPDRFWKDYSSAEAEYCSIRNGYFSIMVPYCAIMAGYRGGGVLANRLVQFFESIQSIKWIDSSDRLSRLTVFGGILNSLNHDLDPSVNIQSLGCWFRGELTAVQRVPRVVGIREICVIRCL